MSKASILVASMLLMVAACAGVRARDTVLLPAMRQTWDNVLAKHVEVVAVARESATVEVVDRRPWLTHMVQPSDLRALSETMRAALASGNRDEVVIIDWATLRQAALDGIQMRITADEIGPGVGMSIVETVNRFDRSFYLLGTR